MDILERTKKLSSLFYLDHKVTIDDKLIEIVPFNFKQKKGKREIEDLQCSIKPTEFCSSLDYNIIENNNFTYWVFNPQGRVKSHKAILLLHGLNERSWDKYLTWAEDLACNLSRPVILFPIAFHMNRTPKSWFSPRTIMPWVLKRKNEIENLNFSSFLNLALSSRLSANPERLYVSGRETIYNICQLLTEIKQDKHLLFSADCSTNIFAYSIGAFLAQILLISNPDKLLSDSKVCIFCGGSIFVQMNGIAKDIMDEKAFDALRKYYLDDFYKMKPDNIEDAFKSMLKTEDYKEKRENFYSKTKNRIKIISLKNDTVMPTSGAKNAVGKQNETIIEELDLPYKYSHQIPFPTNSGVDSQVLYEQFRLIFNKVAAFLY